MKLPTFTEVEVSADTIILDIHLTEQSAAFQGHFPDHPVLPGVVQLDWVMQAAVCYFHAPSPAAQQFRVKFQNIVSGGIVRLVMVLDRTGGWLSFTYSCAEQQASSGKIKVVL